MTGILNALIAGVSGAVKDAYFNLVSLLLPGDGTNGAQNNTFLDGSSNNFTITRNGNTTQGTFSPFSQTGWGAYFDGASDYIQFTNSDFSVSTGDFTAEWWMFVTSDKSQVGVMTAASNGNLTIGYGSGSANARQVYVEWGGTGAYIGTMSNYANTWVHICVMRSSGTVYTFQNGTLLSSAAKSAALGSTANMVIGTNSGDIAAQSFPGYLSNVRFSKAAVYSTSGFTPITSPLTRTSQGATNVQFLTLQSNRLLDSNGVNTPASSPLTITRNGDVTVTPFSPFAPTQSYSAAAVGGSGYFDGVNDSLQIADATALDLGLGNFTIETWIYVSGGSGTFRQFFSKYTGGVGIEWYVNSSNKLEVYFNGGAGQITSTGTINTNTWYHVALVRSGTGAGQTKFYINGTEDGSSQANVNVDNAGALYIGESGAGSNDFLGYVSNLRIIKGTAVYTGAFTPPTKPIATSGADSAGAYPSTTNVDTSFASSACSLLLNFTNAGVVDATAKNVLETVGNAQISTTQSKWGGGSISFDGTSTTGLTIPNSSLLTFGSGDWSIEFWIYRVGNSTTQGVFDQRTAAATEIRPLIYINASNQIVYYTNGADRITASLSQNTWVYVAVVKSSDVTRMYIDGTVQATTYTDTNTYLAPTNQTRIGRLIDGFPFNGYIDDFRITLGRARTTTASPTAPFPLQ